MPKTKFQDFIFTIIMVIVMVYAMVCYNIAFDKGVGNDIFLFSASRASYYGCNRLFARIFCRGQACSKNYL